MRAISVPKPPTNAATASTVTQPSRPMPSRAESTSSAGPPRSAAQASRVTRSASGRGGGGGGTKWSSGSSTGGGDVSAPLRSSRDDNGGRPEPDPDPGSAGGTSGASSRTDQRGTGSVDTWS